MTSIKHIVFSRCRFDDKDLMQKYLDVSKSVLIPALKSQTCKDFTWVVMCRPDDVQYIKDFLLMDFYPVHNIHDFISYVKDNDVKIQTRHDIDDWMSSEYIDMIQAVHNEHIGRYDKFLVQAQPRKVDMRTEEETRMGRYHDKRTSMFLSLCQRKCIHHIQEKKHGWMWEIAPKVFNIPEGYVKWMIHGDNISCNRPKDFKPTPDKEG